MNEINILKELATSKYLYLICKFVEIESLDKNISDLRGTIGKEKSEMEDIENKINTLRAKYDLKKCELNQLNNKLEDKLKIVNEAKRAYSRVDIFKKF
jgi:chromosome segregation ATPase